MAYKFSFADNGIYNANDVNKITSRLVTAGVSDVFSDGVPYNLSTLNEMGMCLYTKGAVPETVNTLKVVKGEEGTVTISPGTAFFDDGAVIEILSGGETLSFTPGKKHYVYLKNDLENTNTCYPACTQNAPTGDFVSLAEIDENGTVNDTRTYAKGKLPGYQSNANCVLKIEDTLYVEPLNAYANITEERSYDIGNNRFRFLMAVQWGGYNCLGLYDMENGGYNAFCGDQGGLCNNRGDALYLYWAYNHWLETKISVSDGVLTLNMTYYDKIRTGHDRTIPFTLYLF